MIYNNNKYSNLDEYLEELGESGNFSGELEIYVICQIFNITIYVWCKFVK